MAPITTTVMILKEGERPDDLSMPLPFPDTSKLPSLDMLADTSAASHGLLVARQSGSNFNGDNDTEDTGSGRSMSVYYFVFFALLICIAVLCVYFVWRRRRNALMMHPNTRGEGYHRDVRQWDTTRHRRHYWTNSRHEQPSREEGLNENGEAPPPYMPKEDEEMGNNGSNASGQRAQAEGTPVPGEPSIPMQTLSRDQAGLKPPGYEQSVQPDNGASGSRLP